MRTTMPVLALSLVAGFACGDDDWGPEKLAQGKTYQKKDTLRLGKEVYANYCAGCHGDKGDGVGPAARFLHPKPRDFRVGRVKFAAVQGGEAPRDEDYLRVINLGLNGTAMPRFNLLSAKDKEAVIAYLKTFYPDWDEDPRQRSPGPRAGMDLP